MMTVCAAVSATVRIDILLEIVGRCRTAVTNSVPSFRAANWTIAHSKYGVAVDLEPARR